MSRRQKRRSRLLPDIDAAFSSTSLEDILQNESVDATEPAHDKKSKWTGTVDRLMQRLTARDFSVSEAANAGGRRRTNNSPGKSSGRRRRRFNGGRFLSVKSGIPRDEYEGVVAGKRPRGSSTTLRRYVFAIIKRLRTSARKKNEL